MKTKSVGKRITGTAIIPVGTLVIFIGLCAILGIPFIASSGHITLLLRSIATTTLTSFALSLNLNSGRFDFSLGSVALLSSTLSAMLTTQYGLSATMMLVLSLLFGAVLGLLHGCLYVLLRLPAIITGLGMTLAYEAIAFIITNGKGVSFTTKSNLLAFAQNQLAMLFVAVIAAAFMIVVFRYTKFGYNYNILKYGQKIAVNTGVKEKGNAVACYAISGLLMGMVGYISACLTGSIQMALNFGSIGVMFTAFLPMFIGGFIGRYISEYIGIVLGAATSAIISLGFVRLGVSAEIQSLVSAFVLVLFLIYLNNEYKIASFFKGKRALMKTAT